MDLATYQKIMATTTDETVAAGAAARFAAAEVRRRNEGWPSTVYAVHTASGLRANMSSFVEALCCAINAACDPETTHGVTFSVAHWGAWKGTTKARLTSAQNATMGFMIENAETIAHVALRCFRAQKSGRRVEPGPIKLIGPAGSGKSFLKTRMADAFGIDFDDITTSNDPAEVEDENTFALAGLLHIEPREFSEISCLFVETLIALSAEFVDAAEVEAPPDAADPDKARDIAGNVRASALAEKIGQISRRGVPDNELEDAIGDALDTARDIVEDLEIAERALCAG